MTDSFSSLCGSYPPAEAVSGGVYPGNSDVSSLKLPSAERLNEPTPPAAFWVEAVPISLQDAVNWGRHNKIVPQKGETVRSLLAWINDARTKRGLPPYRIVRARTLRPVPLPGPHHGGGPRNDYSKPSA